jgi:transcriptional regulator with XRE-family HTH domain
MTIQSIVLNTAWYKRIEILRTAKGWSQDVAAEQCGTTKKNFWLWESGRSYPRLNSRKAIAAAFGIPMSEIFSENGQAKVG